MTGEDDDSAGMATYGGTTTTSPDDILVDVSEYVTTADGRTLTAYGLGACVAVVAYDPDVAVAGLAHAMLPRREGDGTPGKYVDAAIEETLREMVEDGAGYGSLRAYLVGGSRIFTLPGLSEDTPERNVAAARETLSALGVPVAGEAVGGEHGRTVEIDGATGTVTVRTSDDTEARQQL